MSSLVPAAVQAGVQQVHWVALGPVLAPALAALAVLALDAVLPRRPALLDGLALAGPVAGLLALLPLLGRDVATFCAAGRPGACGYVAAPFTLAAQAVVLGAALVCLLLALASRPGPPRAEHHLLLLSATAGAAALAGARDLATLLVALETAALPVVGLVALRRDDRGAEAGLKLLVTSLTSVGLLALGIALTYAATGTLHLGPAVVAGRALPLAGLGLALMVAGIGFKLSLVPFHLWTPDTYAGAPLPVAAFLATVSKAAGLTALVLVLALGGALPPSAWAPAAGVLAVVTMTVGNTVALRQQGAVRLLAWSTVAQAGWVVLPLAGLATGVAGSRAVAASLGYLAAYVVASLLAFAVVAGVAREHADGERHRLTAYAGLARRRPGRALALGFALLCLAGLPPGVVGLVAKVVALRPVVDVQAWALVVVAVANVVLGVAVYLRWLVLLVAPAGEDVPAAPGAAPWAERVALGLAAVTCVGVSVVPQAVAGLLPVTDALR